MAFATLAYYYNWWWQSQRNDSSGRERPIAEMMANIAGQAWTFDERIGAVLSGGQLRQRTLAEMTGRSHVE